MIIQNSSEVGQIKSILLKHPKDAFINQENVRTRWKELNYLSCPDYEKALKEYNYFLEILKQMIPEIHFVPKNRQTSLDSVYVRDSVLITNRGAILCNMGKLRRQTEPEATGQFLREFDIPILGAITGNGRLEGGDVVWFDEGTVAVGQGYRTNGEGIQQLEELISDFVKEMVIVPLPHWQGPDDVLHLMSFISPISQKLAVVYSRFMPVPFRDWLLQGGIKLLEVPDSEYATMACNILAIAPKKCILLAGNSLTKQMLENEGVKVWEYEGEEISRKGAGGPTCLTRPLYRMN